MYLLNRAKQIMSWSKATKQELRHSLARSGDPMAIFDNYHVVASQYICIWADGHILLPKSFKRFALLKRSAVFLISLPDSSISAQGELQQSVQQAMGHFSLLL